MWREANSTRDCPGRSPRRPTDKVPVVVQMRCNTSRRGSSAATAGSARPGAEPLLTLGCSVGHCGDQRLHQAHGHRRPDILGIDLGLAQRPVMNATVGYAATCWPFTLTLIVPVPVATTLVRQPADPGVILTVAEVAPPAGELGQGPLRGAGLSSGRVRLKVILPPAPS
jgi:hypothetical protein